ncbi:hypothetical protein ACCUM_0603 [Candidatus Accumulibacter phosphatis]|uniref:Uncharacterized protein n=1 Tax=Candidatus Accumulibacter phosphatis TaxID=327160 RepID=A0A5S4EK54_9PROT|nr:hypothetical protein ACCUM_0603 [Candidatus Accumulibacter phosphatis]
MVAQQAITKEGKNSIRYHIGIRGAVELASRPKRMDSRPDPCLLRRSQAT